MAEDLFSQKPPNFDVDQIGGIMLFCHKRQNSPATTLDDIIIKSVIHGNPERDWNVRGWHNLMKITRQKLIYFNILTTNQHTDNFAFQAMVKILKHMFYFLGADLFRQIQHFHKCYYQSFLVLYDNVISTRLGISVRDFCSLIGAMCDKSNNKDYFGSIRFLLQPKRIVITLNKKCFCVEFNCFETKQHLLFSLLSENNW